MKCVQVQQDDMYYHRLAIMNKARGRYTEREINEIVTADAESMSKWDTPTKVKPAVAKAIYLSPTIVRKAKVIAQRMRMPSYRVWLRKVIEDRITQEEKKQKRLANVR